MPMTRTRDSGDEENPWEASNTETSSADQNITIRESRVSDGGTEDNISTAGCGHIALLCNLHFLNSIDACLALILAIYGGLIIGGSGKSLSIFCLAFGMGLLVSVALCEGSLRYAECRRCGLIAGGWLALSLCGFFFVTSFYIIVARGPISKYLLAHQNDLFLNEDKIHNLGVASPWLFVVGLVLSIFEVWRYFIMNKLRDRLRDIDSGYSYHSNLVDPLLGERDSDQISEASNEFFPIDENSLHSDPLWWAKAKRVEADNQLEWAKEGL